MRSICWAGDCPITQPYGRTTLNVEPIWNGYHYHCGYDVGMNVGTQLYSPFAGFVTCVGYALLGITDGKVTVWFVHIDSAQVVVGQHVARGQAVARSGAKVPSGGSLTGPHLHIEFQNTPLALLGHGGSSTVSNAGVYGYLNSPPSSLNPSPYLVGATPTTPTTEDDDMTYVGPKHARVVTLLPFTAGSSYRERSPSSPVAGAVTKGVAIGFDYYCYSTSGVPSVDLSGGAGAQPGTDHVWWHATSGQWVPDAILDTSKLAGAPGAAIPAAEPLESLFLPRDQAAAGGGAPVDLSGLATKQELAAVAGAIPTKVTSTLS